MYNEEEIADSLEFCRQIKEYYDLPPEKNDENQKPQSLEQNIVKPEFPVREAPNQGARMYSNHTLEELSNESGRRIIARRPTSESRGLQFINNIFILLVCVLLAYFVAAFLTHFVVYQTTVEGDSMEPALSDGDSILIQKVSYYLHSPERFDIVVFPVTRESDSENSSELTYYVKRVIGLPGEEVQIKNGKVYIDGELLEDDNYCLAEILDAGKAETPIQLEAGQYFVLGDNRNMSTDSRSDYVGLVKEENIVGRVCFCLWPFSHIGQIEG
ncbi:MAG: signal peptidase I [Clostridiaceae bacterium]|nr:signal peptidase I [Clostridiaceae bacterium]